MGRLSSVVVELILITERDYRLRQSLTQATSPLVLLRKHLPPGWHLGSSRVRSHLRFTST